MASSWSALKVELLETGANAGSWGTLTNANLGDAVLGEAITGQATVDFPSDADVTITLTDSAASQSARNLRLNITESSTGIGSVRNLILGSGCQIEKFYLINNTGTGAKTIKNTSGTGISVPAGKATLVYNNGTNVVDAASYFTSLTLGSALPIASGGTGSTSTTFVNLATNVTGTLPVANGGTGLTAGTSGGIPAYTATGTLTSSGVLTQYGVVIGGGAGAVPTSTAVGTATHVLTSNGAGVAPTFQALPAGGVTTFTAGTTGFTPNTATSGAVTLAGTLATTNGGTGLTSFTSTGIVYASSASALATGSALTFNGTDLTFQSAIKLLNSDGGGNKAVLSTHVYGGSGATGTLTLSSTYGNANRTQIKVGTGGAAVISFENDTVETMRLNSTGLGIGTTSPTSLLSVGTLGTSASPVITIGSSTTGSGSIYFGDGSSGSDKYRGYIEYLHSSDAMTFGTATSTRFQIGSAGQLGIGGATYGTAGQVLTSGGSGAAPTWATASGGVTSVATSGGISGGTITSTGTISMDTNNSGGIGAYCLAKIVGGGGGGNTNTFSSGVLRAAGGSGPGSGNAWVELSSNAMSGTWRNVSCATVDGPAGGSGIFIRTA